MTSIRSYASSSSPVAVVRDAVRLVQGARRHKRHMPGEVEEGVEVGGQLGTGRTPAVRGLELEAARMSFPTASFVLGYSLDVFAHLPDPAWVLREVRRVLRPGGVSHHVFLPIAAEDAFHDLRIIS